MPALGLKVWGFRRFRHRPAMAATGVRPKRDLRARTSYRAVVTSAVRDSAGNPLDQNPSRDGLQPKSWRFTTR